ncbi:type VI secretion system-associated protein TagO [Salmonella enterica]|nr:type VI secretion system-associated protein TagO [Salmonella enterica]EJN2898477.1 type VI secretion system-associated protein TagO [Salmonella enterica subsp. enterica serovar Monschaui]EKQ9065474.1 type VI secretion system-associated protein TagO [Salmonella enterica]
MNQSLRWLLPLLLITPPVFAGDEQVTLEAMSACRKEPAALERLDCYDRILAPQFDSGFAGALVKAHYDGEARKRAFEQEAQRADNSTALLLTRTEGERPAVIITTPAIGSLPPRPVLMFSCVDNITRMQVALASPRQDSDIPVTLKTDNGLLRSHWFVRENGYLLEASRGLAGIDEIKQLFDAKTLTLETGNGSSGQLTFNIDGLAQTLAPLREACHWAGE